MIKVISKICAAAVFAFALGACRSLYEAKEGDIVLENAKARFVIGADGIARSLVVKKTGVELLDPSEERPVFSVTQDRPFNNELKLVFPNCRTTYNAKSVRREGDFLVVGFEHVSYQAKIRVKEAADWFLFELEDFILGPKGSFGLDMTYPPVSCLRLMELPVKERSRFGQWLNVMWDDEAAAAVLAGEPFTWIGNERRNGVRHLYADAHSDLKLRGARAAVIAASGDEFLDAVDSMERELDLPRGVQSRRSGDLNTSIYWVTGLTPKNVDHHIALAKKGGFKMMLLYYTCLCKGVNGDRGYAGIADYDLREEFVGGTDSLKEMLAKIKAAGIIPGFHVMQTFIGLKTHYVTPVADPRLNLKRHFTLARDFQQDGGDIFVQENPANCPTNVKSRVLAFGGELMSYEGFTTQRPYKFTGVKRGYLGTNKVPHPRGQIGGILDICEFGAKSCYIDQNTDLQDEIAEKIARLYNCGFEFMYNDGSEGVNVPQGIHVPNSQYRVWKKLARKPRFMEGAAKGHFGWHFQSGANAFDVFCPELFKKMLVRWPLYEAPIMRNDFTRVNFGWWGVFQPKVKTCDKAPYCKVESVGTQYDMWEFGTSRAASWDCPITIQAEGIESHPRKDDLLEVIRRWEDVRRRNWLTQEQKEALKSPVQEHHLYLNEKGEYELYEMEMLDVPAMAPLARAFMFERHGKRVIACWHISGSGRFEVNLDKAVSLPLSSLRYIETDLSAKEVRAAWAAAKMDAAQTL